MENNWKKKNSEKTFQKIRKKLVKNWKKNRKKKNKIDKKCEKIRKEWENRKKIFFFNFIGLHGTF
jgi:hypothetical protein